MTPPKKQLGRYEILETLGKGAMGVVYKAHDPLIERTVALKTISYAGLTPAEAQDFEQRFFLEAKSAGRLNHPNIVTIHDIGHSDDLAYIAMEFLSGESLRTILDSGVVLPPKRIARYACSVANGLAFAHANGVIHRDIKPANIMVLDTGLVKIADFGIALLPSGALTMAGTAVGSPKYMSPEQVLGQQADARSDIFSLGAVLYEMLTGFPPFVGEDLNAILYQVLNTAPPLPSTLNPSLPPGFDRIVARALSKDPAKRYQKATDMATDLRNYKTVRGLLQGGNKTAAESTTSLQTASAAQAPGKPSRIVQLSLGIGALLLLVSGAYMWRAQTPAPATPIPPANAALKPEPVVDTDPGERPAVQRTDSRIDTNPASPPVAPTANRNTTPAERSGALANTPKAKPVQKKSEPKPKTPSHTEATPPTGQDKTPPAQDWKALLFADLTACEPKSFFPRITCKEKARWKHCPGHWGTITECPRQPDSD